MTHASASRLHFLDGLRGVAILLVLLFHAYVRWPHVVPYGDRFAQVPLLACGWVGVQLFFVVSGFVILMTLERCAGFVEFMLKRWLRLFPAMLVCSALVYLTAPLLPERPAGQPAWYDLLSGLLFVDPDTLLLLTRRQVGMLEGAFWSLFIEVKFYALFGGLYFLLGVRRAVIGLVAVFAVWEAYDLVTLVLPATTARLASAHWMLETLGARHYAWFAAGTLYYQHWRSGRRGPLAAAIGLALLGALSLHGLYGLVLPAIVAGLGVAALFTLAVQLPRLRRWLSARLLLVLGAASYPLYLLHENMMVALIAKLGGALPALPAAALPWLPMVAVSALGAWIAGGPEPRVRAACRSLLKALAPRGAVAAGGGR